MGVEVNGYDVIAEAEQVASAAPPYWDADHLRALMIAAWDQALANNFRTTSAEELRWWQRELRGER